MAHKLFVITGPSGIGKSHLMRELSSRYPGTFTVPKLLSTRAPRPGENPLDRAFITEEDFHRRAARREFAWTGTFYGNHYAYTAAALHPASTHVLINALPSMAEEFALLPAAIMIGLTVAPDNCNVIERRLWARGDPPEAVRTRLAALEGDIQVMAAQEATIAAHGKMFEIKDDITAEEVIDWVQYNYLHAS